MPYYMNMWRVYMLFIWTFFCFQASTALCIFMSTHANSWIKVAARLNIIWIRFGNQRAVRRRVEAGMALTAIGEIAQWGGVADCSGCRTTSIFLLYSHYAHHCKFPTWYFLNVRNKFFPPLHAFKNLASGELRLLDVSVRHTFTDA